ncbi:uncharacterized protein LOC107820732 isoform X1 [Nicotiana tabacum]|uniref:Uncharacterized protein LOC107820732 isoform X1 n=2 Tax=Nicotiana TaxID=4085 RepID=A0A1S4CNB9_TOBAC|nr:PREDICTED: uncharacterized protein LOC104245464 [Nicotiana sylvestris]XP_016502555.1 PREDICTED: uncharacterized protein LOC107820732 isoform X1 [Nicotiana tabacum]
MKLEPSMEQSTIGSSRRRDDGDFNLREWTLKAKISRENTNSRRFSASYIRSFREDAKSFRSNISISSTASSPGYTLREEIDPSTYSFTTALKALQAKTVYSWEYMSPDGLALNSKWNEAEKYICNPLSGEVPLECLSAKTLSGRSFRQLTSKITMSAPLIYPSQFQTPQFQTKPPIKVVPHLSTHENEVQIPSKEKKSSITRDVGIQSSSPAYMSSKSPSPARTPSIEERSTKRCVADADDSPMTTPELKSEKLVEVKETRREEDTKRNGEQVEEMRNTSNNNYKGKQSSKSRYREIGAGCLSWRSLCMREKKHNSTSCKSIRRKKKKNNNNNIFLCHINGC